MKEEGGGGRRRIRREQREGKSETAREGDVRNKLP